MYKTIVIRTEPRDGTFQQLLLFARAHCKYFSLNWIEGGPLHIQKNSIAKELEPFMVKETLSQWRKFTKSHIHYQLTTESSKVLTKAETLYLWQEPGLPKDLAFYADKNIPWLISFTQNKESYIFTEAIPFENIRNEISFLDLEVEKPVLSIDGMNFSTLDEFYDEVSKKLIPNTVKWGKNLDAFNDILWGGFGTPPYGFVLVWKNSQVSRERLGSSEIIKGEGKTPFDYLIEIIESHDTIDLILE